MSANLSNSSELVLIGHPFAPSGMGQLIRSTVASLRAVGRSFQVVDCHGYFPEDRTMALELVKKPGPGINIFHINGDEVGAILNKIGSPPAGSFNIVFPAWELPVYPEEWARQLDRFDEVWGFSEFVATSLKAAGNRPVFLAPLSVAPAIRHYRSRLEWGISGSAMVFFFSFDCSSFPERKNPWAAIDAFRRLRQRRPMTDVQLVLKVSGGSRAPEALERLRTETAALGPSAILIDRTLDTEEIKSLLMACDCYVSLHRSEGFGFCLAEAMYFGKPVIATAYSGNMDFMTPETSLLVDYRLVPIQAGAYPHGEGQRWAEPDVEQAAEHMVHLVDAPDEGRCIGERASALIRRKFSPLAVGLRYDEQLKHRKSTPP